MDAGSISPVEFTSSNPAAFAGLEAVTLTVISSSMHNLDGCF